MCGVDMAGAGAYVAGMVLGAITYLVWGFGLMLV